MTEGCIYSLKVTSYQTHSGVINTYTKAVTVANFKNDVTAQRIAVVVRCCGVVLLSSGVGGGRVGILLKAHS